jgi:hypothetical protein
MCSIRGFIPFMCNFYRSPLWTKFLPNPTIRQAQHWHHPFVVWYAILNNIVPSHCILPICCWQMLGSKSLFFSTKLSSFKLVLTISCHNSLISMTIYSLSFSTFCLWSFSLVIMFFIYNICIIIFSMVWFLVSYSCNHNSFYPSKPSTLLILFNAFLYAWFMPFHAFFLSSSTLYFLWLITYSHWLSLMSPFVSSKLLWVVCTPHILITFASFVVTIFTFHPPL